MLFSAVLRSVIPKPMAQRADIQYPRGQGQAGLKNFDRFVSAILMPKH
jgi:hypothetical protein